MPHPKSRAHRFVPALECLESRETPTLQLTTQGAAAGLTLTEFATGFTPGSTGVGPIGITFPADGGVLVSDQPGNLHLFPTDTDHQNAQSFPAVGGAAYGADQAEGLARIGTTLYLAQGTRGVVSEVTRFGLQVRVAATVLSDPVALVANPLNGHLFVASFHAAIYDVDPLAGSATLFANLEADGLAFDAGTGILYAAGYDDPTYDQHVLGFNVNTRTLVFDSGPIQGKPAGLAIGTGVLAGSLVVNTNDGNVWQLVESSRRLIQLATQGSRGDQATNDPNNGSILLTQADRIFRLTTVSSAQSAANSRFVSHLYQDLFHRAADAAGLAGWTNALNAGVARIQVVQSFQSTAEYRANIVQELYLRYLHRAADATGASNYTNALAAGATQEQIATQLTASAEYFAHRGGGTNDGFLNALYIDALGRPVDPSGRSTFDAALAAGVTRAQVAAVIFGTLEYDRVTVGIYYDRYFHRTADPGAVDTWGNYLHAGNRDEQLVAILLASAEYYNRA